MATTTQRVLDPYHSHHRLQWLSKSETEWGQVHVEVLMRVITILACHQEVREGQGVPHATLVTCAIMVITVDDRLKGRWTWLWNASGQQLTR
jgi:hypothetical protein